MTRTLIRLTEACAIALAVYNATTSLWGWRHPVVPGAGRRRTRFRVVVPAHDEENVIANVLNDLAAQRYDAAIVRTVVVADRCRDRTIAIAKALADADVREEGVPGKGAALGWHLRRHPLKADEHLVVLDADNRVPADFLARLSDYVECGAHVVQSYLDVANADASPLTIANSLTYWAGNRMVQLARANLGWPVDLGGTGMCISSSALSDVGGFDSSLAEDQDLAVRLHLRGHTVRWAHDVRIFDEKPTGAADSVRQRARWKQGKRTVLRTHGRALVRRIIERPSLATADVVIRLVQPSRSLMIAGAIGAAVTSGVAPAAGLLPWPIWAAAAAAQVIPPPLFLLRDGVAVRHVVRYPLALIMPGIGVAARLRRDRSSSWQRTPHVGAQTGAKSATRGSPKRKFRKAPIVRSDARPSP